MRVCLLLVAGSDKQNKCFWPSFSRCQSGLMHDLVVVHRDMSHVPPCFNPNGRVILENKIFSTGELPHKAFGAYRHFFNQYKAHYDYFAFISDDVIIKTDNWLLTAVTLLRKYDGLGFVGTQIFNGGAKYPHESHCRAPAWFAKTSALRQIDWQFNSDHDGEMRIAKQFLDKGFFGAQVGNKIDIAYDALECGGCFEGDHISSIFERWALGPDTSRKLDENTASTLNARLLADLDAGRDHVITSPFSHIGSRKVIKDLEPFHGLLYDQSVDLAKKTATVLSKPHGVHILV